MAAIQPVPILYTMLHDLSSFVLVGLLATYATAIPRPYSTPVTPTTPLAIQAPSNAAGAVGGEAGGQGDKLVFSHFMVSVAHSTYTIT